MYQKIIVSMDGSKLAECVLPHVETIAGSGKVIVELVRVIEPLELPTKGGIALSGETIRQIELQRENEARSYLLDIEKILKAKGIKSQSTVLIGKVAESLVDYARNNKADLIVMATHGRSGISRWVRGSVADRVLHSSHIPVLLVQSPGWPPSP